MIPKGQFEFSYWNRAYDLERATFVTSFGETSVVTKESKLGRYGEQKGFYAHLGINIGSILKVGASYQNLLGKNWDDIARKNCRKIRSDPFFKFVPSRPINFNV